MDQMNIDVEHKRIKTKGSEKENDFFHNNHEEVKREKYIEIINRKAKKIKFEELDSKLDNRIKVGGKRTTYEYIVYFVLFIIFLVVLSILIIKYVL